MPDYVPISDLTVVNDVEDTDLFPMSDGSGAYAVRGSTIKSWAASDASAAKTAAQNAATAASNSATAAGNAQTAAEAAQSAVAGSAADAAAAQAAAEAAEEALEKEFNGLSGMLVPMDYAPSLIKGSYWRFSDGATTSSQYFMRTPLVYGYNVRTAIELNSDVYLYSIVYKNSAQNVTGTVDPKSGFTVFPNTAYYVCVNIKRVDGAAITDSDVTSVSSLIKFYGRTDTTLENSNVPADAAATGSNIQRLDAAIDRLYDVSLELLDFTPTIIKGEYWNSANGRTFSASARMRTNRLYGPGDRDVIKLDSDTYLYSILYENANWGIIGTEDYRSGTTVFDKDATYVCINFKRVDEADVTDEDVAAVKELVEFYRFREEEVNRTDNLFDFESVPSALKNVDENAVEGNASSLNGLTLINVSDYGEVVINFEWDYKNNNGVTSDVGPSIVALDDNGQLVTIVSISSGNQSSEITLKNYRDYIHRSFSLKFPAEAEKIVFGVNGSPGSITKYTFKNIKICKLPKESVLGYPDYYANQTAVDSLARNAVPKAGYLHDGSIVQMAEAPGTIPVNENHMGYTEFISSTWDTLLPDSYTEGDAYDDTTTKIHGVWVQRESRWTSTPYGTNVDTYPIYRYTFTPVTGYQKTLFLTSGCHGNEAEAYWGLYRIIRMIYFEGYKYPTLRNLRNVRFIIVPSWNPWGMQHYRRYNAFSYLNTGTIDVAKYLQAWNWLMTSTHKVTVEGVEYDISDVGEAYSIWQTLQEYDGALSLWIDFHTDPYAGRNTSQVEIDDPRGYTPPYGCYGYAPSGSRTYARMTDIMDDFYNIFRDRYSFTEHWHPNATTYNTNSFTGWQSTLDIPCALVEISTFMNNFPYASGSGEMMRIAQEFFGSCIAEFLR